MSKEEKKIILKNKDAQLLKEQIKVVIDGVEINLWQHHSFQDIDTYEGWNKVKSYAALNSQTDGLNGDLVFSGVFQIPRKEVLNYAVQLGFKVHSGVSKNTDFIVVGSENVSPSKVSKALKLNEDKGADIKFIDENSFLSMVDENLLSSFSFENYETTSVIVREDGVPKKRVEKNVEREAVQVLTTKLEGLIFVVSGVFSKFSRDELKNSIEQNGGKVSGSISKKTSYIVAGENMGPSKLAKAEKLEVSIIDEDQFLEMIG